MQIILIIDILEGISTHSPVRVRLVDQIKLYQNEVILMYKIIN